MQWDEKLRDWLLIVKVSRKLMPGVLKEPNPDYLIRDEILKIN